MSPLHPKSGMLSSEHLAPLPSNLMTLEETEVHEHRRQQINNVPQGQAASSNTKSPSPHSGHYGDAGNGKNDENFKSHGRKFHNGIIHGRRSNDGDGDGDDDGDDDCDYSVPGSCVVYDIRDNDPRVHYTGPWVLLKAKDDQSSATTHSTSVDGSTVSLRFNGSTIVVFGTIPASTSNAPTVAYFLDALPPSITTLPYATTDIFNQPLYASPDLSPNEEHLLFINVTKTNNAPYALAGFYLSPLVSGVNSNQSSQGIPPTVTTMSTRQTGRTSANHGMTNIIAGLLGSLLFLFTLGIAIFLFLRWRIYAQHERSYSEAPRSRPEAVFSNFTTTESILRNDPSVWELTPSHVSFNEELKKQVFRPSVFLQPSDSSSEARLSTIEFAPASPSKSLSRSTSTSEKLP